MNDHAGFLGADLSYYKSPHHHCAPVNSNYLYSSHSTNNNSNNQAPNSIEITVEERQHQPTTTIHYSGNSIIESNSSNSHQLERNNRKVSNRHQTIVQTEVDQNLPTRRSGISEQVPHRLHSSANVLQNNHQKNSTKPIAEIAHSSPNSIIHNSSQPQHQSNSTIVSPINRGSNSMPSPSATSSSVDSPAMSLSMVENSNTGMFSSLITSTSTSATTTQSVIVPNAAVIHQSQSTGRRIVSRIRGLCLKTNSLQVIYWCCTNN